MVRLVLMFFEAFGTGMPGMKFFVIFISVKLLARLVAVADLISIASHSTLNTGP
jgi:hypothetical protein